MDPKNYHSIEDLKYFELSNLSLSKEGDMDTSSYLSDTNTELYENKKSRCGIIFKMIAALLIVGLILGISYT